VYRGLRRRYGLPASRIMALLTDDFSGDVERYLRGPVRAEEGGSFTTKRVGGEVGGKNLDQAGDASDIVIAFNANFWHSLDEPFYRLNALYTVAHELAHPIIERARHVSGAMEGVLLPSFTGREVAQSMARIMAGEYRADRLADLITSAVASATVDGTPQPAHVWTLFSDTWLSAVRNAVEQAHPGWPDLVQSYREHVIDLGELWSRLGAAIDQTLTTIVHAQAIADSAETGRDILKEEATAGLPAVSLYLAEPLIKFIGALRAQPFLARLPDVRRMEDEITASGSAAVLEIWRRLGLTVEVRPDRQWSLWVSEPLR
jgi:hypothetical protein